MRSHTPPFSEIGPYRLGDRIGAGGMGEVFEAYDERLDRQVAIKLIRPSQASDPLKRERLRREARASAQLDHPSIVRVYDLVQKDEVYGLVMEYVPGFTLAARLAEAPLSIAEAIRCGIGILAALTEAHLHGIVHRDLKTENVLITPDGHVKVFDFGIAKRIDAGDEVSLTSDGLLLGTFRAMSPEQVRGEKLDPRSDLFSFGSLLYELVTGTSPFVGRNVEATLERVCAFRPPAARECNPDVPEELSALIDRLLEKNPGRRPQSAAEVAQLLERIRLALEQDGFDGSGALPTQAEGPPPSRFGSAERRQLTLLRCSLMRDETGPLDPEELLGRNHALQEVVSEAVRHFGGALAPSFGNEKVAYFGYPQSYEDNAHRAVRAALEITARFEETDAAVQVAIHTGTAVVTHGTRGAGDSLTLGEILDHAEKLEALAGPNRVVVSAATQRLIEPAFDLVPAGPAAFQVAADRGFHTIDPDEAALTPLVAREQELRLVLEHWTLAGEGRGQVVLLAGEAGIGKSRLVREIKEKLSSQGVLFLECFGSPYHRDSALYPVADLLCRLLVFGRLGSAERLRRLEGLIGRLGLSCEEIVPLLAPVLSLIVPERYPPLRLSPEGQRQKTREAIVHVLLEMAERQATVLVVEDLHWIDPSSLEWIDLLVEQCGGSRLLALLTARPDFDPAWGHHSSVTRLTLGALTQAQTREMIDRITGDSGAEPWLIEQVLAKTDGIPLFVEELIKMLQGSVRQDLPSAAIPATLEGWLTARLDRLGAAREVALWASAIGREFSFELLSAISLLPEADLRRKLDRLVESELVYRRGLPPRTRYFFKHALIQEAAYASLLRSRRRQTHERIVHALEERFPEVVVSQPELLAHHCTEAGLVSLAVDYWKRAGERAASSGGPEWIAHLNRALALLATLPESTERDRREISIQVALGVAEGHFRSFGVPECERAFTRAWMLSRRTGSTALLLPVLRGLHMNALVRAETFKAAEISAQLVLAAEEDGDAVFRMTASQVQAFIHFMLGELPAAQERIDKALALYDPEVSYLDLKIPGGGDASLEMLFIHSWVLWFAGYPDQALRRSRECLERARRFPYPITLFVPSYFNGDLHMYRREPAEVATVGTELVRIGVDQRFGLALPVGLFHQGWALAEQGQPDEGIARMRAGIQASLNLGARFGLTHHLAVLADSCLRAGRIEEGLAGVAEALAIAEAGWRSMNPELYRIQAELRFRQGAPAVEVDGLLGRALDSSRRHGAKSLELRAAISYARIRREQGQGEEGLAVLAPVYGWFTEGFETGDLREARMLLSSR